MVAECDLERAKLLIAEAGHEKSIFNSYFTFNQMNAKELLMKIGKRIEKGKTDHPKYLTNIYWQPNAGIVKRDKMFGNKKYRPYVEQKKDRSIYEVHFFYFDFDLKDANGNSFSGQQLIDEKTNLYNKILALPLTPDYIVESRNGFHVYYLIPKSAWRMKHDEWKFMELSIANFIYKNISSYVDTRATTLSRVLRFPLSFHQKKNNNDYYTVHVEYMRNEILKLDKGFKPGSSTYSIDDIVKAFHIPQYTPGTSQTLKSTITVIRQAQSGQTELSSDIFIQAIANNNPEAACFDSLKSKYSQKFETYAEAIAYINKIHLNELLCVDDSCLNKAFKSFLYKDLHPSDYWYLDQNTDRVSYRCRKDNYIYNSIFALIARIQHDALPDLIEKSQWSAVYTFVFKMLGIVVEQIFQNVIERNKEIYQQAVDYNHREFKFLKTLQHDYWTILRLWKEHSEDHNLPWKTCYRDISGSMLAREIMKDKGLNNKEITKADEDNAWRRLAIMEYLGLINRVDNKVKTVSKKKKPANCWTFSVLDNYLNICARAKEIKAVFNKPTNAFSIQKMYCVQKKEAVNN